MPSPISSDRSWMVLLLILAIAAVVRVDHLGENAMSMDELWHMEVATGRGSVHLNLPVNQIITMPRMTQLAEAPAWWNVWTHLDRVTQPPLYFLTLRAWMEAFGESDLAVRWLSVIASLAAIVIFYDAVCVLTRSRSIALWTAALLALAAPQIEYSQLARQYMLLLFFASCAWWAAARLPDAKRRWPLIILLGAASWLMMMTQYFSIGAVAAMLAYVLLAYRGKLRLQAAGSMVAAGVLWLLVWGPQLLDQARRFSGVDDSIEFLQRRTSGSARIIETLSDFAAIPLRVVAQLPQLHVKWAWIGGVAFAALLVLTACRRRRELLLPALWLLGTVGLLAVLDLARSTLHLQVVRYALLASPAIYMFIAGTFPNGKKWNRIIAHALPALVVILCLVTLFQPRPMEFDWRSLARFLDEPGRERDVVVFMKNNQPNWFVGGIVMSYAQASNKPFRQIAILSPAPAPPHSLLTELRGQQRIWLIDFSTDRSAPNPLAADFDFSLAQVPDFPPVVIELTPR